MKKQTVLAFDFGASSGRAILCQFDGQRLELEEVHRFLNQPVTRENTLCWDLSALFSEVIIGIQKAQEAGGFTSIGIDTWGVDFGLLDQNGSLIGQPVHYRDKRTNGLSDEVCALLDEWSLYEQTGTQRMDINTLYQLYSLRKSSPDLLAQVHSLLMMPDLFNYLLSDACYAELTIASTTQMLDLHENTWNPPLLQKLGLPEGILPKLVTPGTVIGKLKEEFCRTYGIAAVPVVAVASHDTASAVLSVPAGEKKFIFISCGTWSLLGTERTEPLITKRSQACNLTNELGFGGTVTFLKNISGLWLIQETRRQFEREGREYSYAQMERMARESKPFSCFIDPDAPDFIPSGDLPGRIRAFCKMTGQPVPQADGEIIRCIYESLAMKYRYAFEQICSCTGEQFEIVHLVGGGTKDVLLCQMTADAIGLPVTAGPAEATAMGNAVAQLIALGDIPDMAEGRIVIRNSCKPLAYKPCETAEWLLQYDKAKRFFQN